MLTPGRKSRRSILTPSRSSSTNNSSRVASPALVEKVQVLHETPTYQVTTLPKSIHPVARDIIKHGSVSLTGVQDDLCYVVDGNRVVVWFGNTRMSELLAPSAVFSFHVTSNNGAVLTTVKGEVMRWNNIEQANQTKVLDQMIPDTIVHTTLHTDKHTLLVLDASFVVWKCTVNSVTKLTSTSAFTGISRRVSSMFWTSPETQLGEAKKIVACGDVVFVCGARGVQRIHHNYVTWTTAIATLLDDDLTDDQITIVDVTSTDEELRCLVLDNHKQLQVFTLSANHSTLPTQLDSIIQLQCTDESVRTLKLQKDRGILYNNNALHLITVSSGVSEQIVLPNYMEILCAAFSANNSMTVFTRRHGLLNVVIKDVKMAVSNIEINTDNATFSVVEKKFIGAYKCFMEFNETHEQAKLQDILDTQDTDMIDEIISKTAVYLLTATPAADPRWGGQDKDLPVTLALQVDERYKRLKGLLHFVIVTNFFSTLNTNTGINLLEHIGKCIISKILLENYENNNTIIKESVNEAACNLPSNNSLSPQDIFFSNIDKAERVFKIIAQRQNSVLSGVKTDSEALVQDLFSSVECVQQTFNSLLEHRSEYSNLYKPATKSGAVLWTDSEEIRTILIAQYHFALETIVPEVNESGKYQVLLVAANLAESVLCLYRDVIENLNSSDNQCTHLTTEYERYRDNLIKPFVAFKVYQIAFTLAEKFHHFTLLVELCEKTDNMAKLRSLSSKYPVFAEVAYKWYIAEGKHGRLLTANIADPDKLSTFLTSHKHLRWLNELANKEYVTAGRTLASLGNEEDKLLSRKKTLLSVGKLSLLASGMNADSENINSINQQLDVVTHQERMKPEILENSGIFSEKMPPLSVPQLIRLCIGQNNSCLEEVDVKKALDLLQALALDDRVSNKEFEELRTEIWSAVICRDDWWLHSNHTPTQIDQTLFYRVVILAYNSGLEVTHFLPNIDDLLQSDLWQDHFKNEDQLKQFQFIIRSGYEQMANMGVMA